MADSLEAGVVLVVRVALGLTFLGSAWGKFRHPAEFASAVMGYQILPPAPARILARVLPWLELVAGFGLTVGVAVATAAALAAAITAIALVAVAMNVGRGREIPCGCFDVGGTHLVGWGILLRNVMLLGLAAAAQRGSLGAALETGRGSWTAAAHGPLEDVVLGFFGVVSLMVAIRLVEWSVSLHLRIRRLRIDAPSQAGERL